MRNVRMTVRGRVQGVGYRQWVVAEARALGLAGWVRNRSDGSVEILAAGEPEVIEQLTQRCRQGPRSALVTEVTIEAAEAVGLSGFDRRRTL